MRANKSKAKNWRRSSEATLSAKEYIGRRQTRPESSDVPCERAETADAHHDQIAVLSTGDVDTLQSLGTSLLLGELLGVRDQGRGESTA